MQNREVRQKLIISLVLLLILLLACVVGVSYAWLSRNTTIAAKNPKMQILAPDVTVDDFRVYQYDSESNIVKDVTTSTGAYEMTQYDNIFLERNIYTPLLFVARLKDVTPGALAVNVYCESSNTSPAATCVSNIVCVKAASAKDIQTATGESSITITSPSSAQIQNLFDASARYFKDKSNGQFVTLNGSGGYQGPPKYGKNTTIKFTINITQSDFNSDGTVTVYLIFDYSPELVAANLNRRSLGDNLTNNAALSFPNDITAIYFANDSNLGD